MEEINKIKSIQTQQNEEILKLHTKLDTKIEQSQNELRDFFTQSIQEHQNNIESRTKQQHLEILNTVTNKLQQQESHFEDKIDLLAQQTKFDIEQTAKSSTQTLQNEILPKLHLQNKMIETQQSEIQHINESMNRYEQELKTVKTQTQTNPGNFNGQIFVNCTGGDNERLIPKFNGRAINPNEYLNKLKRYYDKNLNQTNPSDPTEYLKDLLEISFEGPASRWLHLIKNEITDWNYFAKEFTNKYWSREIQRGIRTKIENERYRTNGTLTRTEYFTERVLLLRSVTPSLSEEEIVTLLAERFDTIIQDSLSVQNISTIRDFERLLQKEDIRDNSRRNRNHNTQNNNNNTRQNQSQSSQNHNSGHQHYNPRAYQPRTHNPNYSQNHHNNHNNNNSHNNYRNYNPNYNNNYRSHHNDKPYQRNTPQRNENYDRRDNRPYPTPEQNQVCAIIRQNTITPTTSQESSPEPNRMFTNSTMRSENESAL